MIPRSVLCALTVLWSASGCSGDETDTPTPATGVSVHVVATEGGVIACAECGAALFVPPGALAEDTTLTMRAVSGAEAQSHPAVQTLGSVVELGPDGLRFESPATLVMWAPVDIASLSPGDAAPIGLVVSSSSDGTWDIADDQSVIVQPDRMFVASLIQHFTQARISSMGGQSPITVEDETNLFEFPSVLVRYGDFTYADNIGFGPEVWRDADPSLAGLGFTRFALMIEILDVPIPDRAFTDPTDLPVAVSVADGLGLLISFADGAGFAEGSFTDLELSFDVRFGFGFAIDPPVQAPGLRLTDFPLPEGFPTGPSAVDLVLTYFNGFDAPEPVLAPDDDDRLDLLFESITVAPGIGVQYVLDGSERRSADLSTLIETGVDLGAGELTAVGPRDRPHVVLTGETRVFDWLEMRFGPGPSDVTQFHFPRAGATIAPPPGLEAARDEAVATCEDPARVLRGAAPPSSPPVSLEIVTYRWDPAASQWLVGQWSADATGLPEQTLPPNLFAHISDHATAGPRCRGTTTPPMGDARLLGVEPPKAPAGFPVVLTAEGLPEGLTPRVSFRDVRTPTLELEASIATASRDLSRITVTVPDAVTTSPRWQIFLRYMVDATDTAFSGVTNAIDFSRHAVFVDDIRFTPGPAGGRGDLTIVFSGEPTFPVSAGYVNGSDTFSQVIPTVRPVGTDVWEVDLPMTLRCDGVDTTGVGSTASVSDMAGIRGAFDFRCL